MTRPCLVKSSTVNDNCQGRTDTLHVYSLKEILAEKLCALLGRTEPRDLYDIHYMLAHGLVDVEAVSLGLEEKMGRKEVDPAALADVLERKKETFRRLWEPQLAGQMPDLPHLDEVIRETNRWLRQGGLV
jgi:predicted nucleotidyltransferase component of viral defense system